MSEVLGCANLTQFVYDGLNPMQEQNTNGNNANLLTGRGLDEVFTRTDKSGTMNFLRDNLNSTVALTDSSGNVHTQYTYEPFGNTMPSGTSNTNPYQFTGRENDPSGLYYMRARYYHPTLQRFLSPDPMGFDGGDVNLFRYAGNSPTNFIDPTGLDYYAGIYPENTIDLEGLRLDLSAVFIAGFPSMVIGGGESIRVAIGQRGSRGWFGDEGQQFDVAPPLLLGGLTGVSDISQPPRFPLGPEWKQGAPNENFVNPNGESIHPDFKHGLPKGWHYDWHMQNPKRKLSLRQYGEELQVWLGKNGGWIALDVALDLLLLIP